MSAIRKENSNIDRIPYSVRGFQLCERRAVVSNPRDQARKREHGGAKGAAEYIDKDGDEAEAEEGIVLEIGTYHIIPVAQGSWKDAREDLGAVEGRDGEQVEDGEGAIDRDDGEKERAEIRQDTDTDGEATHNSKREIGEGSRRRHDRLAPYAHTLEVVRIVRHRLGPAEEKAGIEDDRKQREDDRADKIDMRQRIESEASRVARRRVAKPISCNAMHHLVDDDRKNDDRSDENTVY